MHISVPRRDSISLEDILQFSCYNLDVPQVPQDEYNLEDGTSTCQIILA